MFSQLPNKVLNAQVSDTTVDAMKYQSLCNTIRITIATGEFSNLKYSLSSFP